jgi:DNA mismatch endonuclease (patch repair protein)
VIADFTPCVVAFIDSDFWHRHPKRFIMPATNYDYWSEKIVGNVATDRKLTKELKSQGWKVIRIWEYDVKHNFEKSIQKTVDAISK